MMLRLLLYVLTAVTAPPNPCKPFNPNRMYCAANSAGCTVTCAPGTAPVMGDPTCTSFLGGPGPSPTIIPNCEFDYLKLSLSCSTLTPTTDTVVVCTVKVVTVVAETLTTGVADFQAQVVSSVSGPVITDGASDDAEVVTISGATGTGSFTVTLAEVRTDVVIQVHAPGLYQMSNPVNLEWTAGFATSVKLVSWTPSTFAAGDWVSLVFSALDQYSNVATSATGNLLSVTATPCTYYNSSYCQAVSLNSSPISFKLGQNREFKTGLGSVVFTTTLSTSSVNISVSGGSDKLTSSPTIRGSWVFNFAHAQPTVLVLNVTKSTAIQGNTVPVYLTLYDAYENVAVNIPVRRYALKLQGGSAESFIYGTMRNGVIRWDVTWNYVDTLYLTVLDPDGTGVARPPVAKIVFSTNLDVSLILATVVPICSILIILFLVYVISRETRLKAHVKANQAESRYIIDALVSDAVSTDGSTELAGSANLATVVEDTREATREVRDTQALLLDKISNVDGVKSPKAQLSPGVAAERGPTSKQSHEDVNPGTASPDGPLDAKQAEVKKSTAKAAVASKFQRALGSMKKEQAKDDGEHEREMAELKRKHEEQEAQLQLAMQNELEKLEAELRRNVQQKKAGDFQRLKETSEDRDMNELKQDLEKRAKAVDKTLVEEKEIQAALMQKKIQSRQQRLMKVQQAQASSNRREEIMARLDYERKQLDNITDVNDLVAALARVNELQAKLGTLTN